MAEQSVRAGHYPALDTLRGVAALTIAVTHAYAIVGRPGMGGRGVTGVLYSGYLAVDFFFVLSGFVLFLPVARRAGEIGGYGAFMVKRFTRLWPAYALVLLLAIAAQRLTGVPAGALPPSAQGSWDVIAHAVLLPTVLLGFGPTKVGLGVDPVVWSLSIEMCFSLVLPLIARWWFRHPVLGLGAALLVSRAWVLVTTTWGPGRPTGPHPTTTVYYAGARLVISLPSYALHFGVGMSLAYLVTVHGAALRRRLEGQLASVAFTLGIVATLWAACLLGLWEHHYTSGYRHWTDGGLMLPAFALVIVSATLVQGRIGAVLTSPFGRLMGEASYSFYLLHLVVMQGVHNHYSQPGWSGFALNLATIPFSFVIALTIHRYVEKPAALWGRRIAARGPRLPRWELASEPESLSLGR